MGFLDGWRILVDRVLLMCCPLRCLVPVLFASSLPAQLSEAKSRAIDALCARYAVDDAPGVSVAAVHKGERVFAKGYGRANLEYDIPITPETAFHVASVTKQFTAFALVLLAQDGKLSLEDDVRKHAKFVPDFGAKISIRHLLNHTSGLRDQWELLTLSGFRMDDVLTRLHILRILENQRELNFAPGTRYKYSNMGYTLAAEIVQRVSGASFAEFCKKRIFAPLGMTKSHMHLDHRHLVRGRAYGYEPYRGAWRKKVLSYANAGATSLFSTPTDLCKWLANFASGSVGGRKAIDELTRRSRLTNGTKLHYALGVGHGKFRGRAIIGHGGVDQGFRSNVWWFPEEQLGVAVVANRRDANPRDLTGRIASVLLELPEPDSAKPTKSAATPTKSAAKPNKGAAKPIAFDPADYSGRYLCPELEVFYHVFEERGQLRIRQRRFGSIGLRPSAPDRFVGPGNYGSIRFERAGGKVTGFRLSRDRVKNLEFVRSDER